MAIDVAEEIARIFPTMTRRRNSKASCFRNAAIDNRSLCLIAFTVETYQLQLLKRIIVGRRGIDLDAGQQ
jgi:hypothetical protein